MFPKKRSLWIMIVLVGVLNAGVYALHANAPTSTGQAVERIADRLVAEQILTGGLAGVWPSKGGVPAGVFTGTMAAGLAEAYGLTCDMDYKTAAESAGQWIWNNAPGCSLYHDDAYALMQLSLVNCNPADNQWRTALEDFYGCVEFQGADPEYGNKAGTELFIAMIEEGLSPVFATLEVAYYTVAAYYVNTPEKTVWRSELIRLLHTSNVESSEQVMALGIATWALAQTGQMDSTAVYVGSPTWVGFPGNVYLGGVANQLSELPELLESYQVPASYPVYNDHFYPTYDPPNPGFAGWTETNMFAVMGLAGANEAGYNYRDQIDRAWAVNMQPVDLVGDVWYFAVAEPGVSDNATYYHYAGEYLQYMAAARLAGDINLDDSVDLEDLEILAIDWLVSDCSCSKADLNSDRKVNLADFARILQGWALSR